VQDGEREANRPGPLVVLQRVGAIELLAHVVGHRLIELRLRVRKAIWNGVGNTLREQGFSR
jgi:hypothetical protein